MASSEISCIAAQKLAGREKVGSMKSYFTFSPKNLNIFFSLFFFTKVWPGGRRGWKHEEKDTPLELHFFSTITQAYIIVNVKDDILLKIS